MFPESRPTDSLPANSPNAVGWETHRPSPSQAASCDRGQQDRGRILLHSQEALARGVTVRLRSLAR